jgi:hypothetical protein
MVIGKECHIPIGLCPSRAQRTKSTLTRPELISRFIGGADAVTLAIGKISVVAPALGRTLDQLWIRAEGDFDKFRNEIEDWYDRQMQRVSGWYSRWTKWIMIGIGLAIAIALNVSLTTVGRSLWTDSTLRNNIVAEATAIVKSNQTTTTVAGTAAPASIAAGTNSCVAPGNTTGNAPANATTAGNTGIAGYTCLESIDLPIGWNSQAWPGLHPYLLLHILGIIMVGIATSFGAPFWFGLLNNLINLKGGGPTPPPAAQQRAAQSASSSNPP